MHHSTNGQRKTRKRARGNGKKKKKCEVDMLCRLFVFFFSSSPPLDMLFFLLLDSNVRRANEDDLSRVSHCLFSVRK